MYDNLVALSEGIDTIGVLSKLFMSLDPSARSSLKKRIDGLQPARIDPSLSQYVHSIIRVVLYIPNHFKLLLTSSEDSLIPRENPR